jgi:hypothetical protein
MGGGFGLAGTGSHAHGDELALAVGGLHQRPVLAPKLLGLLRAHRLGARPRADLLDGGRLGGPIGSEDQLTSAASSSVIDAICSCSSALVMPRTVTTVKEAFPTQHPAPHQLLTRDPSGRLTPN